MTLKSTLSFLLLLGVAISVYSVWQPGAPTPAAHRYSADSVFYLRRYVSIRTPKGSIGLLPGQEVTLNGSGEASPGKISVNDGRDIVEIERTALTHDMDEAAALQASDARWQDSVQADIAQSTQTAALQTQAAQAAMADGINTSSALMASQNTVGTYQTRLIQVGDRRAGGGYYVGSVVYPATGARPVTSGASAARSAEVNFAPVMTAQPARIETHLGAPLGPIRTEPASPVRLVGATAQ